MRRILIFAVSLGILAIAAVDEQANAQSVLKISRGLKSNNVSVFIDRAVVLESERQYKEAGLEPVDKDSVPAVVPEPETWLCMLVGLLVVWLNRRKRARAAGCH